MVLGLLDDGLPVNRKTSPLAYDDRDFEPSGAQVQGDDEFAALAAGGAQPTEQDFTAMAPNQKWVGNITFLTTGEDWL